MRTFKKGKKWCIDITVNKRRIRKPVADTKAEAEKVLTKIKYEMMHKRYDLPLERKISFLNLAKIYVEKHVVPNQKSAASTLSRLKHLVNFFGDMNVGSITLDEVDSYISWRLGQTSKRKKPVSKTTVNRELEVLKNMLNTKAKDWGYVSRSQIPGVNKYDEYKRERILTYNEIDRLMDALADGYLKDIIIVALNTGMRKTEILSLEYKHVNLDGDYVYVEKSKTGKSRKIPLNDSTKKVFERLFSSRGKKKYIFENPRTRKHFVDIKHSYNKVLEKAEIYGFTFHDLRHTFATYAIINGSDLFHLSKILGHARIETTLRYLSATSDGLQKVVNSFIIDEKKMISIEIPFAKVS